jgi:hypothetical protein
MDKPIENFYYTYLYLKIYQNTYIFVQYWYKPSTYLLAYLIVTYFPTHVPIHLLYLLLLHNQIFLWQVDILDTPIQSLNGGQLKNVSYA